MIEPHIRLLIAAPHGVEKITQRKEYAVLLTYLLLVVIGLAAGVSGSLVGLGGGFIVVPALPFLFPASV